MEANIPQEQENTVHIRESLFATLESNLERIRFEERAYYDVEQDQEDIKRYYAEINPHETNGKVLFRQLTELLRNTHNKQVRYSKSDEYLKTGVDLHADGSLRSIYSGKEAEPRAVIEESLTQLMADETTLTGHIANIEHVVPQSWFREKEPMRGDMHHLFYCEKACNERRGNKVYKDFADYTPEEFSTEWVRNECGKGEGGDGRQNGVFEPEYGKGFAARAMLYFFLRYPDAIEADIRSKIDTNVLLQWHKQDPPGHSYEKHRNQAIFDIQGNRNPLIDLPELAETIDFGVFHQ
ncbi:endonuclease I family protein [Bacillus atrophaeus]|uniref:endonuclease I family protein n=1 Tax=Bacillus atrophaeus TaxID=1452 RepID=UPI00287FF4F5|nr:endonuclease [Bacillus atrophaeus]MDS9996807.1 endonuclease [Bacillus atrophaeus]